MADWVCTYVCSPLDAVLGVAQLQDAPCSSQKLAPAVGSHDIDTATGVDSYALMEDGPQPAGFGVLCLEQELTEVRREAAKGCAKREAAFAAFAACTEATEGCLKEARSAAVYVEVVRKPRSTEVVSGVSMGGPEVRVHALSVSLMSGKELKVPVKPNTTWRDVKAGIKASEGILLLQQRLVCGLEELLDHSSADASADVSLVVLPVPTEELARLALDAAIAGDQVGLLELLGLGAPVGLHMTDEDSDRLGELPTPAFTRIFGAVAHKLLAGATVLHIAALRGWGPAVQLALGAPGGKTALRPAVTVVERFDDGRWHQQFYFARGLAWASGNEEAFDVLDAVDEAKKRAVWAAMEAQRAAGDASDEH